MIPVMAVAVTIEPVLFNLDSICESSLGIMPSLKVDLPYLRLVE